MTFGFLAPDLWLSRPKALLGDALSLRKAPEVLCEHDLA
jgi:hypothetical protein